jgi:hypothetical protein
LAEKGKKYREYNKNTISKRRKKYYKKNRRAIIKKAKVWAQGNREHYTKYHRVYVTTRRKEDPLFAATQRLRSLARVAFRHVNARKTSRTFQLLGCTGAELLAKWGVDAIPEGYHIDHIVPLSQAQNKEEAEKLCHWRNLRLLKGEENLEKSDNKTRENIALCKKLLGRAWKE